MKPILLSLLAILLVATAPLLAQDNELVLIQKNYYTPENFEKSLAAERKLNTLLMAKGATHPMAAYVFDDHTVEYVWEVDGYAAIDRLEDNYQNAQMRTDTAQLKALDKERQRLNRKFFVGREIEAFSYRPEGATMPKGGYPVIEVLRYKFAPEDSEALFTLAEEIRANNVEKQTPLPYSFQVYPMGLDENHFEVVHFALSEADLEQKRAENRRLLKDPKSDALNARRDRLITRVSKRVGKHDPAQSIPDPEETAAAEPEMEEVYESKLTEAGYAKAQEAIRYRNELSKRYYYPATTRIATNDADRTLIVRYPLRTYADLDRLSDRGSQMQKVVPEAELKTLREKFDQIEKEWEKNYVYEHKAELGYDPAGWIPADLGDQPHARLTDYTCRQGEWEAMKTLLEERQALAKSNKSPLRYEVWDYAIGGPMRTLLVVEIAKDRATLEQQQRQEATGLQAKNWERRLLALLETAPQSRTYDVRKDLSYQPRTTQP